MSMDLGDINDADPNETLEVSDSLSLEEELRRQLDEDI
jgi:hypothetical protein